MQRPHPARSRAASDATVEGRPDVWLIGSPAYNFKKPVNSVSELYPLPVYMSLQPESSREIVQWLSKSLLSWWREILEQRLSKSLLSWGKVVLEQRLSKPLLSWWREIPASYQPASESDSTWSGA